MGYEQVTVCRNGSKKRPYLNYCYFPVKSADRKKWEVLRKRADKKCKRLIDPRMCSLHFKGTDIEISISGRKRTAAFRLSLTLQKRRIRPVARSVLIIERGVELHNEKP